MVTPGELLAAARELSLRESEVWWRCSASRAYYAAFLHLRDILEERVGLPGFGTAEDHRQIVDALRLVGGPVDAFVLMRRQRNLADYAADESFGQTRALDLLDVADLLAWE